MALSVGPRNAANGPIADRREKCAKFDGDPPQVSAPVADLPLGFVGKLMERALPPVILRGEDDVFDAIRTTATHIPGVTPSDNLPGRHSRRAGPLRRDGLKPSQIAERPARGRPNANLV
jgi:hypothetical protein